MQNPAQRDFGAAGVKELMWKFFMVPTGQGRVVLGTILGPFWDYFGPFCDHFGTEH